MTHPELPEGIEQARVVAMFDADGNLTNDEDKAVSGTLEEVTTEGVVMHVTFTNRPAEDGHAPA